MGWSDVARGRARCVAIVVAVAVAVAAPVNSGAKGERPPAAARPTLQHAVVSRTSAMRLVVLHNARVGGDPVAIAVDPRTRRALIVDRGPRERRGTILGRARLLVADAVTGRVLRTVVLPQPAYLAPEFSPAADDAAFFIADPIAHRAFLATCSVDRSMPAPWLGTLYMLDTTTGAIRGTTPLGDCEAGLVDDPRAGYVIAVEGGAGVILVLDARTGRTVHSIAVTGIADGAAFDPAAGRLAVVDTFGTVQPLLVDLRTGVIKPAAPLSTQAGTFAPGELESLAVDPRLGRLIIGTQDSGRNEYLYILDDRSGKALAWIAGTGGATLIADAATGRIVAVSTAFDPIDSGPAILSVIDTRSRRIVRSDIIATIPGNSLTEPIADAVDPARGRVFLTTSGDTLGQYPDVQRGALVFILDPRSGRTLGRTMLSGDVAAIALDPATGHLLVASTRGTMSVIAVTSP